MELNKIKSWQEAGNSLVVEFQTGFGEISFTDSGILRFRYTDGEVFKDSESYILDKNISKNNFHIENNENYLLLTAGNTKCELYLDPFSMVVFNNGIRVASTANNFLTVTGERKVARFTLGSEEGIYGLGQDPMANLNQRDKERRMWHQWGSNERSGNAGVPFMLSTNGYGILLNSSWPARFAIGSAEVAEFSRMGEIMAPAPWEWNKDSGETDPGTSAILLDGGELDLFVICGNSFDEIINGYYKLTGFPQLLPKWAYGFMQCKNRYRSQKELLSIARTIREKKIPCDVLIIDWLWFREFGDLDWDKRYWPDVDCMFKELNEMGFKVMQAQHPFLAGSGLMYEEFEKCGYMNKVPEGKRFTFDHTNPEARKAWWKKFKYLYEQGIRGYWTDMGELEEHFPGTKSYLGDREEIHNIYSLLWAKGLYDGQRKDFGTRVVTLARTTYAGMQKYGTSLWSGDIDASWETLKRQVVVGQGVCLSGMPYWTTDVGGFITNMDFTPELYVRWLEWGIFCPLFRTHGTKPGNEPWSFGKQTENICKEYIRLRYKLLPYIYSCARKITETGKQLMRAMIMDYSDDPEAVSRIHQFMFGPNILVAAVTDKGRRRQEVYLPEGIWYDYWTDSKYGGKALITVSAPLDRIPLFIKSGSIIPMEPAKEFINKVLGKNITVHVYPGSNAFFELYDDDGLTYTYEDGKYIKTIIEYTEESNRSIKIYPLNAKDDLLESRDYTIILHDADKPKGVFLDNSLPALWRYCQEERILEIKYENVPINSRSTIVIEKENTLKAVDKEFSKKVRLFADTDMENDGKVTVNLTIDSSCDMRETFVSAKLIVPEGWAIRRTNRQDHDINAYWKLNINKEETQKIKLYEACQLSWEVRPAAETLPLISEGSIEVEFIKENNLIEKRYVHVSWGNEFITRFSIAGSFENKENSGFDYIYEPEVSPDKPFYIINNNKVSWIRDLGNEVNCFGYVDLRRLGAYGEGEAINGVSYCKCSVWSPEDKKVYLELSAESGIKIWLNNEEVFKSKEIVIDEICSEPVNLTQGWNKLMIKSTVFCEKPYSGREYGFNIRFIDKDKNIVNDLLYKA